MKITPAITVLISLFILLGIGCTPDTTTPPTTTPPTTSGLDSIENTLGFGILDKIKGIWDGPVTSSSSLGSYPKWVVDFRPISASQISAKNELDTLNDIHLSFFVAKYNGEYRVFFRNGGGFAGFQRVSYFSADSVSETGSHSFYRFSEILKGSSRAYTDVLFKSDSLIVTSYTNKSNSLTAPVQHMDWRAKRQTTTPAQASVNLFGFPQKVLAKDFSNSFNNGETEAIYYSLATDPYPENQQPYLGQTTINYSFSGGFTPSAGKKVFLMITTEPLISGFSINYANLKYLSRYVFIDVNDTSFVFNYMHPGTYYLYALYDADSNGTFSSGDRTGSANTTFTLTNQGTATATALINFQIP